MRMEAETTTEALLALLEQHGGTLAFRRETYGEGNPGALVVEHTTGGDPRTSVELVLPWPVCRWMTERADKPDDVLVSILESIHDMQGNAQAGRVTHATERNRVEGDET